jgi:predicted transcriptional regulator
MTLTIELPPATLEKLQAEARATGKDVQTLIGEAIEARFARRRQTFAEILKPVHDEVEASGMSEQELADLVDQAVAAIRADGRPFQTPQ